VGNGAQIAPLRTGKIATRRCPREEISTCDFAHPENPQDIFGANRAVGRVALEVKAVAGISRRGRVHEQGSLRVRFPGGGASELEAVIINTAGGMTGGDRFDIEVAVGRGAQLVLTTAAAEKIYRMLETEATVSVRLKIADDAALAWLPRETILFDRAGLVRTTEVDLAPNARLLLLEAAVFGRSGMGETVEHGRFFDRRRIRRDGKLVHAEAIRLDGAIAGQLRKCAVANGSIAIASLLIMPGDDSIVASLRALAPQFRGEFGASAWNGFALVRLVATDGAALHHDVLLLLQEIRGPAVPRLWLN
jgi:urease accessory protein